MTSKITPIGFLFFILVFASGCASRVDVYKASADTEGVRYFLPQPFLKVTPRTDGGVDVEVVYLQDTDNEYAVQAKSIFGSYTIDINLSKEGFLDLVNFNGDSTGVVKQLIQSAGNVTAAKIDAKSVQAQARKKEAKEAADKEAAAVDAAEQALKQAELNLEIAGRRQQLLENLKAQGDAPQNIDDQIFNAKLAVEETRVKHDAALGAYEAKVADTSAANAPSVGEAQLAAPEAVFFRIDMKNDSVVLIQAFPQENRQTWRLPKEKVELPELDIGFAEGSAGVVRPAPNSGALAFKLTATNRRLLSVTDPVLTRRDTEKRWPTAQLYSLLANGKTVVVDLPKNLPVGDYFVEGIFVAGPRGKEKSFTREFTIRIER